MFKKIALFISALFLVLISTIAYAIYQEIAHNDCGLSIEQSREKAQRFLARKGLPLEHLVDPINPDGTCQYTFIYNDGNGEEIDIIIMSTWLHGVKLSYYDHSY